MTQTTTYETITTVFGGQLTPQRLVAPAALRSSCVMMVDDEPLMTELVQGYLEDAGYRKFVVTNDPRQTIALMRANHPAVVLLDLMMPQMSGFDVLEQIAADEGLRFTPVIVLTAASDSESKLRALNLGASDLLAKPVDESELLLRVRNTLAFRQFHERMVNFDDVTSLPSRRNFERQLGEKLAPDTSFKGECALFIVSVPVWSQVHETMGQESADTLARTIARRLQDSLRAFDAKHPGSFLSLRGAAVARLRGEEFALLLPGLNRHEAAELLAKALGAAMAEPVELKGQDVVPRATIGIALSPADGHTAEALIRGAEQARSLARKTSQPHVFFSVDLNRRSEQRLLQSTLLRHAIERKQLLLHYQPIVDMGSGLVSGVEALLRWQHPNAGLVGSEQFQPLAEELGLGSVFGQWVAQQACADAVRWVKQGVDLKRVAINITAGQWREGRVLETLRGALRESGLPPSYLAVQLNEGMLHEDFAGALKRMREISEMGVVIVIDDFGSGQTSLGAIKKVPALELKVDAALVQPVPSDAADLAVARAVVTLAHSLGMTVVAKGVAQAEQLLALSGLEFDKFQGPLYQEPVPADKLQGLGG
jgi:diguanylate cyclase (GGDEF)-like protein